MYQIRSSIALKTHFSNLLKIRTSLSYSYDLAKIVLQEVELINMLKLKMIEDDFGIVKSVSNYHSI